jgi:hypothetical protein
VSTICGIVAKGFLFMSKFGTELLAEMERLYGVVKGDNARLEVQLAELEAQRRQLVLEVEALRSREWPPTLEQCAAVLGVAEKELAELKAELAHAAKVAQENVRLVGLVIELRNAAQAYRRDERNYAQLDSVLDKVTR